MLLHDFIYEWDGKRRDGEKPVSWSPGAYHVRIIRMGRDSSRVTHLTPHAVILKNARTHPLVNTSLTHYLFTFAEIISRTYGLDMKKTLWVEIEDGIRVARLHPDPKLAGATVYPIHWRPARPNEMELIEPYLAGM